MSDPDDDVVQATISWPRAVVTAVVVATVAVVLLAYGSNWLLNHLGGLDRSQRVGIATTWFFVVLIGLAFGLRRLQRRGAV